MPKSSQISDEERRDRLRLMRTKRIGPMTYRQLLDRFGSAAAALAELPAIARAGGGRRLALASAAKADEELARLEGLGGRFVTLGEDAYPAVLARLEDAPPGLVVLGRDDLLAGDAVAIVGARNASVSGRRLARELAAELGAAGLTVVSGLARGIDRAAHVGALPTGTVAVMAGGVDVVYPEENRDAYERIHEAGTLVSEVALATPPTARHFPRRNRIIAGLSLGVVIVEAAQRSGSLITARLAAEQGREVMCVPGSPLDPRARGPNRLIREGATLVQGADDVLEALHALSDGRRRAAAPAATPGAPSPPAGAVVTSDRAPADLDAADFSADLDAADLGAADLNAARARIAECMSPHGITVDEILRVTAMPPALVHQVLLEMEIAGRLERQPGGRVATA